MAVDLLVDIADIIAEPVSGSVSIRPAGGATLYRTGGQVIAAVNATETLGTGGGPTKALFPGVPTHNDSTLTTASRGYALEVIATLRRAERRLGSIAPLTLRWVVRVEGTGAVNFSTLTQVEPIVATGYATVGELAATFATMPSAVLRVRKTGSTWPARPTTRTDTMVLWVGPAPAPPIGGSGMVEAQDVWWDTSVQDDVYRDATTGRLYYGTP